MNTSDNSDFVSEIINLDTDDGSFMLTAIEQVISSRTVLKYSYILGYYLTSEISNYHMLKPKPTIELSTLEGGKQLFEYQQEMLEKNTELLSELTEEYCKNVEKYAVELLQTKTPDSKSNNTMESPATIVNKRDHIINLTQITEKFMNHLLESIGTNGNVQSLLAMNNPQDPISAGLMRTESETEHYDMMIQTALLDSLSTSENNNNNNLNTNSDSKIL